MRGEPLLVAVYGEVEGIKGNVVLLRVTDFVFQIHCDSKTVQSLKAGERVRLHTHLEFNQDGFTLYGFLDEEKLEVFEKITRVSKVGHRTALKILSSVEPDEFVYMIKSGDIERLSQVPGIGRKTAERLVSELKDEEFSITFTMNREYLDAVEALTVLGFSRSEARDAVRRVFKPNMNAEQIVKEALRLLSKKV